MKVVCFEVFIMRLFNLTLSIYCFYFRVLLKKSETKLKIILDRICRGEKISVPSGPVSHPLLEPVFSGLNIEEQFYRNLKLRPQVQVKIELM